MRKLVALVALLLAGNAAAQTPQKQNAVPACSVGNLPSCIGGAEPGRSAWILDGADGYFCVQNQVGVCNPISTGVGVGDIDLVGNCSVGNCFSGSSGTILTSTTLESIDLSTPNVFIFKRNDPGLVVFQGADDAGAADTVFTSTGTGFVRVGSGTASELFLQSDLVAVTESDLAIIDDGTITGNEITDGTVTSAELADGGIAAADLGADSVTEAKLKSVNPAGDELCLTYEVTLGDFEWQACGSSVGTGDIESVGDCTGPGPCPGPIIFGDFIGVNNNVPFFSLNDSTFAGEEVRLTGGAVSLNNSFWQVSALSGAASPRIGMLTGNTTAAGSSTLYLSGRPTEGSVPTNAVRIEESGQIGQVWDEWANPLTTNGPNDLTSALQRQGAPNYRYFRQARTDAAIDQMASTNVMFEASSAYHTGRTPTINQEGAWPYLGINGATCPYDETAVSGVDLWPNCDNFRNHTGFSIARFYKLDESETSFIDHNVYCSGVGDCIKDNINFFALGSAPTGSDEGFIGQRMHLLDVPGFYPNGTTSTAITGGTSTSVTTTIAIADEAIAAMGKWSLIVFDDATLTSRAILNNAGANDGIVGYDDPTRTWTIANTADWTGATAAGFGTMSTTTHDTGWCFALDEAARSIGGSVKDYWLLIVHGPGDPNGCSGGCSSTEFETAVGNNAGAPPNYVPGTNWPGYAAAGNGNGKIARCEQVGYVDFQLNADDGKPDNVGPFIINFAEGTFGGAGIGNIASGKSWEWSPFGFPKDMVGTALIMDLGRASNDGTIGMLVSGSGVVPTDERAVVRSGYQAIFVPGTNPTRSSSFYGFELVSPTREAAFRYAPWTRGPGSAEGYSTDPGNFGYPVALTSEIYFSDWASDFSDHVGILRVSSQNSGARMEVLANTQDKAWIFKTSEAVPMVIKGEDDSGLDATADTTFTTSGTGKATLGTTAVTETLLTGSSVGLSGAVVTATVASGANPASCDQASEAGRLIVRSGAALTNGQAGLCVCALEETTEYGWRCFGQGTP